MVLIGPNESQAAAKSIDDKRPEHIHQKTSRGRTTHSITQTHTPASTGIIRVVPLSIRSTITQRKRVTGMKRTKEADIIYIIQRKVQINAVGADLHLKIAFFTIKINFSFKRIKN